MSARAPFVPRPASRIESSAPGPPQSQSPPPAGYEAFRPNGLLPPPGSTDAPNPGGTNVPDARFKPLNLSGLNKAKNDAQQPFPAIRFNKSRPSLEEGASLQTRPAKPFSPAHQKSLVAPRPTSPFFPNAGHVSMNSFRSPLHSHQPQTTEDGLSSNKAHISSSAGDSGSGMEHSTQPNTNPAHSSYDSFRYPDGTIPAHRTRSAVSHPSLESIHEVEEEDDHGSPRKVTMGPPPLDLEGSFSGTFSGDFPDPARSDTKISPGLRRTAKRIERSVEDDDEFEYGVGAKRYKMSEHQDEYPAQYGGRVTPARYSNEPQKRTATPAQVPPLPTAGKTSDYLGPKHALYELLGRELDITVEAHADAYKQAQKKWSECSVEEWTQGADELGSRFGKMLDFVKEHMTAKLALYASLHSTLAEHRTVLSDRERTLTEVKDGLLREGGAVVGGIPNMSGEADGN